MQELQEVQEVQEDTFRENPLIAALFPPDSSFDQIEVFPLDGYLGRSSRRLYVRLYHESLRGFLDIPRDRVRCFARRKPIDGLPYATDLIWIEGEVVSGDDLEPIYLGGELAKVTTSSVRDAWKSADKPEPPADKPEPPAEQVAREGPGGHRHPKHPK
jgi:hypothetical protein